MRKKIPIFILSFVLVQNSYDLYGGTQRIKQPRLKRTHKSWINQNIRIPPLRISADRTLVTVGDTIYMLNSQKEVIWKWYVGQGEDILDQPIVDPNGTIIGIALDGILFALDLNGKEKWRQQMNGAANYRQIKLYRDDQYLLLMDMCGYRIHQGYDTEDKLLLCKSNEVLDSSEFPRNGELKVEGGRILAVIKQGRKNKTKEIRFD